MGTIIRKGSASEDIFSDVRIALTACRERGGVWAAEGEDHLADILRLGTSTHDDQIKNDEALVGVRAARDLQLALAHKVVGAGYDRLWNDVGRPGHDAWLALLYPNAGSTANGPIDERAPGMEGLAELLETVGHPRVPGAVTTALAADVRAAAASVAVAVGSYDKIAARRARLSATLKALARIAQHQLTLLKRVMEGKGYREAEIHEVIPSHSRRSAAKAPEPPVEPPAT